jgi:hypothetical protein
MYLKSPTIFKNPSHLLKKASISLKMSSKRIEIFKKFHITLKSLKFSENIFKIYAFSKKSLAAIAALLL